MIRTMITKKYCSKNIILTLRRKKDKQIIVDLEFKRCKPFLCFQGFYSIINFSYFYFFCFFRFLCFLFLIPEIYFPQTSFKQPCSSTEHNSNYHQMQQISVTAPKSIYPLFPPQNAITLLPEPLILHM